MQVLREVAVSLTSFVAFASLVAFAGSCSEKAEPPAPAPEKSAAAEAARPAPAPTPAAEPAKAPGPVWPDPLPDGWRLLDDYEKIAEGRSNLWGGFVGTWKFHGGQCQVEYAPEGGSGRMKLSFNLPMGDSQCGTFEYLAGGKGKPKPVDIRPWGRVTGLLKSADGKPHTVRIEIAEYDSYDEALQGYVGESKPIEVGPEWQRFDVKFDDVLHPMFNRKMGKQVGVRVDRKDQEEASGMVWIDNLAFAPK